VSIMRLAARHVRSFRSEMKSRTVNEVRWLFWPWCLMTFAGLVPLVGLFLTDKKSDWPQGVAVFGFFGGAALLTALRVSPFIFRLSTIL